jgi:hypothetical protein
VYAESVEEQLLDSTNLNADGSMDICTMLIQKKELVLEMVRCMYCKEKGDPREYDEDGKLHQTRILKNPFYD